MYHTPYTLFSRLIPLYPNRGEFFSDCLVAKKLLRRFGKKVFANESIIDSLEPQTQSFFAVLSRSSHPLNLLRLFLFYFSRSSTGENVMISLPQSLNREELDKTSLFDEKIRSTNDNDVLIVEGQSGYLKKSFLNDVNQLLS